MTKCLGCGVKLQNKNKEEIGFTNNLENKFCERCFNITHYNKYLKAETKNFKIKDKNALIILVTDFLNLYDINFENPTILVITKADLLPKSVNKNHLLQNIKMSNVIDKIIVSSKNNYNLDALYQKILPYKKAYIVGYTSVGKSSLINKMIKNYGNSDNYLTVSNLPSTTLDLIKIKINNITLIDTPGFLDKGSLILKDKLTVDKIMPKKQIRPIIYQIKNKQSILIEDFVRLDIQNTNIILYMSNNLNIKRVYKNKECSLKKHIINMKAGDDLVIKGLGFITFKNDSKITLWLIENVNYLIRKSII